MALLVSILMLAVVLGADQDVTVGVDDVSSDEVVEQSFVFKILLSKVLRIL